MGAERGCGGDLGGALGAEGIRLGARVGEGGVGVVYRAERGAGEQVAIKVLRPHLARDATLRARVLREAGVLGSVTGPHVGRLLAAGEDPERGLYLVLAWIEGPSLATHLAAQGPLPVPEATRLGREILHGLAAAHAVGVAHRDVKPDNVLLEAGRSARVVDFGLAAFVRGGTLAGANRGDDLTPSGRRMGTPGYAAPEQVVDDPERDHRVDLWAAGVVLYEMLAGARPFVAASHEGWARAVLVEEPTPLRAHRRGVPEGLEAVLRRALEKEADERFASAEEFAAALQRFAR
ncbi:MAG: serine/threonine-protein kinase [Myxococcota bacterium]